MFHSVLRGSRGEGVRKESATAEWSACLTVWRRSDSAPLGMTDSGAAKAIPLTDVLRYGAEAAPFFFFMGIFKLLGIDAASALYRAAQFIEGATSETVSALPPGLDQAPQFGAPVYHLRMLPADDTNGGYSLEATPGETGPMRDDICGTFTLDATGQRGNRSGTSNATPESSECWNTR